MENNEYLAKEDKGLSLNDLVFLVKKNLLLIILITFVLTLAGAIYGLRFKQITYTSTASAIVVSNDSVGSSSSSYQNMMTSQYMIDTFKDFIFSNSVIKDVINSDACEAYELSVGEVTSNVTVSTRSSNSLLLVIKYKSDDKDKAIAVLNQILHSCEEKANSKGNMLLENKFIIIDEAEELSTTASRGATTVILACFLLGLVLSFGIVLIKYFLDDTYTSKEAIERRYNINVIAALPNLTEVETGGQK